MVHRRRGLALALVSAAALTLVLALGVGSAAAKKDRWPAADKVVLFASDGMRPDLMQEYAKHGSMPTYHDLMQHGALDNDGMLQAFPPNTGVGWYTIATGTYPSEHGSTNNTFFRGGDSSFNNSTSFSGAGVLQADTIANSAERAGKKVAQIDWTGGRNAAIKGPTVDFLNFFSGRGVLTTPIVPSEQAGAASFGLQYQVASFAPQSGWTNLPATSKPAMQSVLTLPTTFGAQNPTRVYDVLVYAAGPTYDRVLLVRQADAKDASKAVATLTPGVFQEIKLKGADGLIGARAGESAGFYAKVITLAGDLSSFKLYFTSIARVIATCDSSPGGPCAGLPAGILGEDRLEKYIADNLPTAIDADFAPEEAGIIDEDTYVQQGRDLEAAYGDAVLGYILGTLQPDTDLAMVGYPFTDEASHQFMGLVTEKDPDGSLNPCYDVNPKFDDVTCTGRGTAHRVDAREGYIRSAYQFADAKLGMARDLMGGDTTTIAVSDHGFGAQRYAINATKVLFDTKVHNTVTNTDVSLHASNANASNCRADSTDLAKACWAGGTTQIYVNSTLPNGITYEAVRTAAINAFQSLSDPANPGKQLILTVLKKEDLRDVEGSDSLHPNRSGDVVVVSAPPYQFDAGTNGVTIALSHFFGQHGFLPDYRSSTGNVNMHAVFVAGGPGIKHRPGIIGVRAIDVAPTVAFLMGIPGPLNARGNIVYDAIDHANQLREATILYISDFHGQLTPLSATADTFAAPSFGIGGAAYIKPWFDWYRQHAVGETLTLSGGDAVGATPPISSFFGDKPTMNVLNMLGLSADTLGNHNFDRGSDYLRTQLIPIAAFPYLSANTVFASTGKLPKEWDASHVFDLGGGFKLGVVGYTLPELATLIFPGYLDPFMVTPPAAAVNAEAAKLAKKADAIVAAGHLGGDGTVVTAPTGELMDFANALNGVDVALGGHTHTQYITTAANGVLVAESPNSGTQFTRIRIVIDKETKQVAYKTADFHKMWDIGVTPDPKISDYIADLNTQLAPIFNTVIGSATKAVPRADQCGRGDGRTCESLIGDVTTDALMTTYSTDFAITNSGGLRADLTCPAVDLAGRLLPGVHTSAVPDHARAGARRASVRQRGLHREDPRRGRAETVAGERRLADAVGPGAVPAGLGAVLHVQRRGGGRQPRPQRGAPGGQRLLHGRPDRPDVGVAGLHPRRERLHGDGRRRLPERLRTRHDPEHHGSGRCRLHHGEIAGQPVRSGSAEWPDQLHGSQPRLGQRVSDRGSFALVKQAGGPAPAGPPRRIRAGRLNRKPDGRRLGACGSC